jgi:hypothetical protein
MFTSSRCEGRRALAMGITEHGWSLPSDVRASRTSARPSLFTGLTALDSEWLERIEADCGQQRFSQSGFSGMGWRDRSVPLSSCPRPRRGRRGNANSRPETSCSRTAEAGPDDRRTLDTSGLRPSWQGSRKHSATGERSVLHGPSGRLCDGFQWRRETHTRHNAGTQSCSRGLALWRLRFGILGTVWPDDHPGRWSSACREPRMGGDSRTERANSAPYETGKNSRRCGR